MYLYILFMACIYSHFMCMCSHRYATKHNAKHKPLYPSNTSNMAALALTGCISDQAQDFCGVQARCGGYLNTTCGAVRGDANCSRCVMKHASAVTSPQCAFAPSNTKLGFCLSCQAYLHQPCPLPQGRNGSNASAAICNAYIKNNSRSNSQKSGLEYAGCGESNARATEEGFCRVPTPSPTPPTPPPQVQYTFTYNF
jgi:hypothetical protein